MMVMTEKRARKKDEIEFKVIEHSFREKSGKNPTYKVVLENPEGDRLSKKSDDELLFRIYPLDAEVTITTKNNQTKLDEVKS